MNPTEVMERERRRREEYPRRRYRARLLPLGRLLTLEHRLGKYIEFERLAFSHQTSGYDPERDPILVHLDHEESRPVGRVTQLTAERGWLTAEIAIDPGSWATILHELVLGNVPYEEPPVSVGWTTLRTEPRGLLEGSAWATIARVNEVSICWRHEPRIEGAAVVALRYIEPKPAPRAARPRREPQTFRRNFGEILAIR